MSVGFVNECQIPNLAISVEDASTQVLPQDNARGEVTFINASDTDMWLSPSDTAELQKGIYLPKDGGSYSTQRFARCEWSAIHAATGNTKLLTGIAG